MSEKKTPQVGKIELPTYDEARDAVEGGNASPLEYFIAHNEPAERDDEREFREGLASVLSASTAQVSQLKDALQEILDYYLSPSGILNRIGDGLPPDGTHYPYHPKFVKAIDRAATLVAPRETKEQS